LQVFILFIINHTKTVEYNYH